MGAARAGCITMARRVGGILTGPGRKSRFWLRETGEKQGGGREHGGERQASRAEAGEGALCACHPLGAEGSRTPWGPGSRPSLSLAPCGWGGGKGTARDPPALQRRGTQRPQPAAQLLLQLDTQMFTPTLVHPQQLAAPPPGQPPAHCLSPQGVALPSLQASCSPGLKQAILVMNLPRAVPGLRKGTYF